MKLYCVELGSPVWVRYGSRVVDCKINVDADSDSDHPYPESSAHGILAFDDRPNNASNVEVNINKDHNQHKPQNVMDEELRVKERNRRNVFNVSEQRGEHHSEYRNNLDDNASSHDSAMLDDPSPTRKVDRNKNERDEHKLNHKVCRGQRSNINCHIAPLYSYLSCMKALCFPRRASRKRGTSPARRAAHRSIHMNVSRTLTSSRSPKPTT